MKHWLLSIGMTLLLFSCAEEAITIPPEILSEDTMVEILTDFHIIEGAYHKRLIKKQGKKQFTAELYGAALREHGTTKAEFDKSYDYYLSHPELMEGLMEEVMEELSKQQAAINANLPDSVQDRLKNEQPSGSQPHPGR